MGVGDDWVRCMEMNVVYHEQIRVAHSMVARGSVFLLRGVLNAEASKVGSVVCWTGSQ